MTRGSWLGEKCDNILTLSDFSTLPDLWEVWNKVENDKGFMTGDEVWHYSDFVELFHRSTPLGRVELRMKKESKDLVASTGHLWIFWKQMERERFFREYPVLVVASKKFKIISKSYSRSLYALKSHTPSKHTQKFSLLHLSLLMSRWNHRFAP